MLAHTVYVLCSSTLPYITNATMLILVTSNSQRMQPDRKSQDGMHQHAGCSVLCGNTGRKGSKMAGQ
jgi:hypothetical protein